MKRGKLLLGIIQLFVAVGALPAGYLMLIEPDGSKLGMTVDLLAGSPFKNFFVPGLALFIVNGIFNMGSSVFSFCRYKYASLLGLFLGSALIIWVIVQVYSVGLTHFLQPTYFFIGIAEIVLSFILLRAEKLKV